MPPENQTPEKPAAAAPAEADQLRVLVADLMDQPSETPAKPEKPAKVEKPAAAQPGEPAVKPAKPRRQPAAVPAAEPIDYEKLAEAVGRGVATAAPKPEKAAEKPAEPDLSFLTKEERKQLPILREMAKAEEYKGLDEKFLAAAKSLHDYARKWEEDHPGEEWDPDAEEHKSFIDKINAGIDWDDTDFLLAAAELKANEKTAAALKGTNDKLKEFEDERATTATLATVQPAAAAEAKRVGRSLFTAFGDDYKDIVDEQGRVNQEAINKVAAADPVAAPIIFNAASQLEMLAAETRRMFSLFRTVPDGNGGVKVVKFDPEQLKVTDLTPMQRDIASFAERQEAEMLALPPDKQVDSAGRRFLGSSDYYAIKDDKKRAKFWTFDAGAINDLRAAELVDVTQKLIEAKEKELESFASARGWKKDETAAAARQPARPAGNNKPASPETGGGARPAGGGRANLHKPKDAGATLIQAIID